MSSVTPSVGNNVIAFDVTSFVNQHFLTSTATWNIETQGIDNNNSNHIVLIYITADHLGGDKETILYEIDSKYHELVPEAEESVVILLHDKKYVKGGTLGAIPYIHKYFSNRGYDFITTEQCYDKCDDYVSFCRMNNVWPGTYETP